MSYHIFSLIRALAHDKISFSYAPLYDGDHIIVKIMGRKYSIICHEYSYGHEKGLLEIDNNHWHDVIGWLTAEEVLDILKTDVNEDYN